jgi:hypothetical protein
VDVSFRLSLILWVILLLDSMGEWSSFFFFLITEVTCAHSPTRETDTWPWTAARHCLKITWFWNLTVHLNGRQWDVHGGWNQAGSVLSAEHPPAWEQITLQ